VRNNLPGGRDFCPLVRRTARLQAYLARRLQAVVRETTGQVHPDVLARAAAFLLLQDSRASFAIEGERLSRNRAERWGQAIAEAGLHPLTVDELLRLQSIVIADARFVKMGLRQEGGFIGVHDRVREGVSRAHGWRAPGTGGALCGDLHGLGGAAQLRYGRVTRQVLF
jgi:hypothetical protein